jgi:type IX secretion system PorP/SprF family membrane protein
MMKAACRYCLFTVLIHSVVLCHGQQQPMYTQYMFNGLVLNPAYAGSQETFSATAIMRKQWVGIDGSPETQTFSANSPLDDLRNKRRPGSHVSLGLTLFRDRIAITSQTGFLASYAYKLRLANNSFLSFGLQGGFSQFRIQYSDLNLNDPWFGTGDITEWHPDFGAGAYYQTASFYAGLSAPQMLRPKIKGNQSLLALSPHYFFTMGYLLHINRSVKLKPSVLIKKFTGNIYQFDINCNLFLNETLNLGLSWRSFESLGTLIQFQLHPRFGFGYAYDIPYGNEISRLSNGSHEIMVNYRVPKKKIRTINPRFF